ncbi:prolipoprotein diacylglyceryl transferase [Epilithonimonas pallida]|uniref:Phosphatidylglycerol--prolipoprotein diacylglyceryl transferase n=2 Tax=Epilithonimonas pallida TaxID=373671 RepID=A0ABY1QWZ0_9FLAO|nr:prolipoprotein diacylglyceryl transferase [Epilithonimonas pallida]SMP86210.1 prolipoprotein diacylglyceryl transferase [Epilithonimonas pallida]
MNNIFLRFYLILFAVIFQLFSSQTSSIGLSDGTLKINNQEDLAVKIFATQSSNELYQQASKNIPNELIILNEDNVKAESAEHLASIQNILETFKTNKFQFLDKNFKPVESVFEQKNIENFKYLLKSDKILKSTDNTELETQFKIWDPMKGIPLGPVMLHFYSLMFIFAFGLGYVIMAKIFKIDGVDEKFLEPLFTWTLIGTILGARLGHVIFYQPELFKEDFFSVFLPISTKGGLHFTGFSGLASHGATIALIFTTLYYSFKIIKKNPFWVYDRIGIVVALGGAFVRMGNFFNSEIIGKPVDPSSPFAILFPQQSSEYGVTIPRYPSQLFEAVGYFCLFVLLWFLYRKTDKKYQQGWLFGLFFIILWAVRFFVEFLKEPQGDEFIQFAGLNTGQVLSIPFMIAGFLIMIYSKKFKLPKEEAVA